MWNSEKMDLYDLKRNGNFVLKTIDLHTAGEPLRVLYEGVEDIKAQSVLDFRRIMKRNYDHIRKAIMWEPRGHADMYGCILLKPFNDESDFGVIFMHNEGYSTMCGHGILGIIKLAVECELVEIKEPITKIKIETPAGIVEAFAEFDSGRLKKTYFYNVPSFVYLADKNLYVDGVGEVEFDIAFGGAFYAYVDANKLGISMSQNNAKELIDKGMKIKRAVMDNFEIKHPFEKDLSFLYGVIFTDGQSGKDNISRNVCIFADGEVDRSPTGTGVSGRVALHFAKGEIKENDTIEIESIIGSKFRGGVVKKMKFKNYDAVVPFVEGEAFITGKSEFAIDSKDDLKYGFFIR
jgi:proline racemase